MNLLVERLETTSPLMVTVWSYLPVLSLYLSTLPLISLERGASAG